MSREEMYFLRALRRVLPLELLDQSLIQQLVELLSKYIHTHLRWNPVGQERFLSFSQFRQLSLPPTLLLQIAILPSETRAFIELDPRISAMMVDRALGGTGADVLPGKPLSEVEKGVFSFLFFKCLQQVQNTLGEQVQVEFRLENIIEDLNALPASDWEGKYFYRLEFHMALENEHGFFRLYIPTKVVEDLSQSMPSMENTPREYDFFRKRFHRVAEMPLRGFFKIGLFELEEDALSALQPGDIVLMKECSVERAEDMSLRGTSMLQFGAGSGYGFRCGVGDDGNLQMQVELQEVVRFETPHSSGAPDRSEYAESYAEPSGEYDEEPYDQGASYASGKVSVLVEIGQIELSNRDLLQYHLGQVIDLHRSPYDPFDLVVDGQVIGHGVLEEVEGQFGIKIEEIYW